jgi:aspartyl-tRNA(Asn)/glutamyl-tRNA(Gln) amidotransferase subunit A
MSPAIPSIRNLHAAIQAASTAQAESLSHQACSIALQNANRNKGHNTYLWRNPAWTFSEVERIAQTFQAPPISSKSLSPLQGIPVSLKDCFDLSGSPTSCGTMFYRDLNGIAPHDSWLVEKLRTAGAVITGKTHLHPLAYGITGENPEFGDCIQPGNEGALTGGSSSGAAASILEGSAMAAIGTDTGGSIRVPAALCGIAGYRASFGRGDWRGGAHLAPSFDTIGWLYRDLEDGPLLGSFFAPAVNPPVDFPTTFAIVSGDFLTDCEPPVLQSYSQCQRELQDIGLNPNVVDVSWWSESMEIFAPIQASEAAAIHKGHFANFEASIQQRLEWGASLSEDTIASLRKRHDAFRARMDALLAEHSLLLLPAAPVARLDAGADHSQTRTRLLRYTSPISLSGMPAVTIPFVVAGLPTGGMQLVAARERDADLLALTAKIGLMRNLLNSQAKDMVVS